MRVIMICMIVRIMKVVVKVGKNWINWIFLIMINNELVMVQIEVRDEFNLIFFLFLKIV